MQTAIVGPRKTRRRVLGLIALAAWLMAAWAYWRAQSALPRQTLSLDLPNYSFVSVPAGTPFAVINPGKTELAFLDPTTTERDIVLKGDLKNVYSVIAATNHETLATLQVDGTGLLWHRAGGARFQRAAPDEPGTFPLPALVHVACSPDGRLVGGHGPKENRVRLWDVASGSEVAALEGHLVGTGTGFFPDSRTLATLAEGAVKLWDLATHRPRLILGNQVRLYAIAPDGRSLATCDANDRLTVWDSDTGEQRASYRAPDHAQTMFFSPDSSKLGISVSSPSSSWYSNVSGWFRTSRDFKLMSLNEELEVVNAATGQACARVPIFGFNVLFADDNTLAALSKAQDAIQLWDLPPRRAIPTAVAWACLGVAILLSAAWWFARNP
jgi:WD40 repeat protein